MIRHVSTPRVDWRQRVEATGLSYHTHDDGPYWDESACYELTAAEVTAFEKAAAELHRLCIDAAGAVIERGWWSRLAIPEPAIAPIIRSWERDDFSLYGRFDFALDAQGQVKLLEYNADTPTSLVESAVTQWFWLQEVHPACDQFNSIHERLVAAWQGTGLRAVHFSAVKDLPEDEQTILYLQDTCAQGGLATHTVAIEDIGWDEQAQRFVDLANRPIENWFKLYPWEWLWQEKFGGHLTQDVVRPIEPLWKMLLSNKALLPILWELFPEHPHLLPAFETPEPLGARYVRKPKLSREGANITLVDGGVAVAETTGGYGGEGFVFQAVAPPLEFSGNHPVFGVWMVDHEPAGLGIREDTARITGNLSRFVPHYFRP